jgi:hypothetical protein
MDNVLNSRKLVGAHGVTADGGRLISYNFSKSVASAHAKFSSLNYRKYEITNIAVFLLGSLMNAFSLGYPNAQENKANIRDYFQRAVAARMTWARHVSHFYIVTGNGQAEKLILSNSSSAACRNLTYFFQQMIPMNYFEMHECGDKVEIMILHLPHCSGDAWGPDAACCRCQGAMTFYHDMHHYYQIQLNTKLNSSNHKVNKYPNWMTFSDDDYYVRMTYLEAVLNNPKTPSSGSFIVHGAGGGDNVVEPGRNLSNIRKTGWGAWLYNHNCSVPCMHRMPWLSWAGFALLILS